MRTRPSEQAARVRRHGAAVAAAWRVAATALLLVANTRATSAADAIASSFRAAGAADRELAPRPSLQVLEQQAVTPTPAAPGLPPERELKWALLLSAALPGAGEYYAGHTNRALVFGTVEAGIWISYATFKVQEDLRRDSAIDYAAAVAGALPNGDDDYYAAVGQFLRSDGPGQWNEFVRRRERDTNEDVGREYLGDDGWAWPSEDQFVRYRDMRKSQLEAEDAATNMLAVAIVNRIASMVDVFQAMRADAKHRKAAMQGFGLRLDLGRTPREPLACLRVERRF